MVLMRKKEVNQKVLKGVKYIITQTLKHNANQTTCAGIYQPKVPAELSKFSKFYKND